MLHLSQMRSEVTNTVHKPKSLSYFNFSKTEDNHLLTRSNTMQKKVNGTKSQNDIRLLNQEDK